MGIITVGSKLIDRLLGQIFGVRPKLLAVIQF
jgi:hypothetical protein